MLIPPTRLSVFGHLTEDSKTARLKMQLAGKLINVTVAIELPEVNARIGICGLNFTAWRRKPPAPAKTKPPEPKPEVSQKTRTSRFKLSVFDWIEFGKTLAMRFFKLVQVEKLKANLTVGLGNPATTGLLMGAYFTLRETVKDFRSVQIIPDFVNQKITGEVEFRASIRLIKTIPILIFTMQFLSKRKK